MALFILIGCSGSMFDDFFAILFQLKLSLNEECLELGLGLGADKEEDNRRWGVCRSGLKGISTRTFCRCYMIKVQEYYYTRARSTFGLKVHTAINTTLGGNQYSQFDALSLGGYVLDFEVLLDRDNRPVPIPERWRLRSSQSLAASIGGPTLRWRGARSQLSPDLIGDMRRTEEGKSDQERVFGASHFPTPEHGHNVGTTSLASDWGSKFAKIPAQVARKLAIEVNGNSHYALNCDHPLGPTVLKTRHLQYLGWEVLNVSCLPQDLLLCLVSSPDPFSSCGGRV